MASNGCYDLNPTDWGPMSSAQPFHFKLGRTDMESKKSVKMHLKNDETEDEWAKRAGVCAQ